jgi:hypothetical protein
MNFTTTNKYKGMGDFLAHKFLAGDIVEDDGFRDYDSGYYFAQFGRRVIEADGYPGCGVDYTRFDTIAEACNYVAELHDARGPVWDWDGIVVEGVHLGEHDTYDEAVYALAQAMVDAGCFPDAFYVNGRGNFQRIDTEIRALHDDGGDKMRVPDCGDPGPDCGEHNGSCD